MATVRKPPLPRMTLSEFLDWEPGDTSTRAWQLIDGEPVAMAPGTDAHGAIQSELNALLRNPLLERQSICRVVTEPGTVPKPRANRNYRGADLAATCAPPSREPMVPEPGALLALFSLGFQVPLRTLYRTTWLASA